MRPAGPMARDTGTGWLSRRLAAAGGVYRTAHHSRCRPIVWWSRPRAADLLRMAKTRRSTTPRPKGRRARQPTPVAPVPVPFEISARVERQALTRPFKREPGAPLSRPLRIYTLDPSVSHRIGGVATVNVPYEKVDKGPIGSLFEIDTDRRPGVAARAAARPRRPVSPDGRRPRAVARQRPVRRADDLRRVQPDVRGVSPRARPRHLVGLRCAGRRRTHAPDRAAVRHAAAQRRLLARGRRPVLRLLPRRARSRPASPCRRA